MESTVAGNVQHIVSIPARVLRLGLVSSEAPLIVHYEFVLMHASRQLLDHRKLVPRTNHRDLLFPPFERRREKDILPSVSPGENHWNQIVAFAMGAVSAGKPPVARADKLLLAEEMAPRLNACCLACGWPMANTWKGASLP
eukprot:CAMPEP_0194512128 /NCGR_PEP_ID=MMETSP0253-20130528/44005_1 /TAXON_ID=2966 /ORGANISM="Noctiluca scintillans" /LENGTH=140 /DNA_ID=CAMNT_0039355535 /DNA_START=453 /DNA_END=872 /DNA_ORIENTATION=-